MDWRGVPAGDEWGGEEDGEFHISGRCLYYVGMNTPIALRLAVRQWFARPLRPVLCSLAIAAAVALIVVVGAAMDSLRQTVSGAIGQALGVAEIHVRPSQRGTEARVPESLLKQLEARPDVELASARLASLAVLTRGDDRLWFDVVGISEP